MKEKQKEIACDCCHCKNRKKELGKDDKKQECCKEKKKEYCHCLEVVQLNVQGKRYTWVYGYICIKDPVVWMFCFSMRIGHVIIIPNV